MQENHLANPPLCIDALRDAGRFVLDQVDQHIFPRNETYLIFAGNCCCVLTVFPAKFIKQINCRKRHEAFVKSATTAPGQYGSTF